MFGALRCLGALILLARSNVLAFLVSSAAVTPGFASSPTARGRSVTCSSYDGTLYDIPVSNNGGRVRLIIYDKGIEDKIEIARPENFKETNPAQGKIPVFVEKDTGFWIPESDTIARYVIDRYPIEPSYVPSTLKARTLSDLIARFHDMYITTIQGSMYKMAPPFGTFNNRRDAQKELIRQLKNLEELVDSEGPYIAGKEKSLADATVFPTGVFLTYILPKHFGFKPEEVFGPKLTRWWNFMLKEEKNYKKVYDEIMGGIDGWEAKNRWATILGAGWKDLEPRTIFDKIISKDIPAQIVYEDDKAIAFKDIEPQAPVHILLIPKERDSLTSLRKATEEHQGILGHLMVVAAKIADQEGLKGYRLVTNDGESAGQSVFHLHFHILGNRKMAWPPG